MWFRPIFLTLLYSIFFQNVEVHRSFGILMGIVIYMQGSALGVPLIFGGGDNCSVNSEFKSCLHILCAFTLVILVLT